LLLFLLDKSRISCSIQWLSTW